MDKRTLLTSWDDGSIHDLRLALLLKKYDIPAIFYIPCNCELNDEEIRFLSKDFKIGGHTVTHPDDMKRLSKSRQEGEVGDNKKMLEAIIQQKIVDFAYPSGKYNDVTIDVVKKVGFKRARTTMSGSTELNQDPYKIRPSVHCYPETSKYNKPDWQNEARIRFDYVIKNGGRFELWGHSWEIEKFGLWEELENFLKYWYEAIHS